MKCCSVLMSLARFIVLRLCIYFVDLIAFFFIVHFGITLGINALQ